MYQNTETRLSCSNELYLSFFLGHTFEFLYIKCICQVVSTYILEMLKNVQIMYLIHLVKITFWSKFHFMPDVRYTILHVILPTVCSLNFEVV